MTKPFEWRRLTADDQPEEGRLIRVLRVYWCGDEYGFNTALMQGEAVLARPDLGHEGWTVRWDRSPDGFMMVDDLNCASTNIDEIMAPVDFDRDFLPDGPGGDHIYWRYSWVE